jgi:hypothetical protein
MANGTGRPQGCHPMTRTIAVAAASLALAAPFPAVAHDDDGGDDEVRVRVACIGGTAELRLKAEEDDDGGTIEIELRADTRRRVATWRVVLLHERTLVFQGVRRSDSSGRSLRMRRTVPDWPGLETVTARLTAGDRQTCRLNVTI